VTYRDNQGKENGLALNGTEFDGRNIKVNIARPREKKSRYFDYNEKKNEKESQWNTPETELAHPPETETVSAPKPPTPYQR
jgi:RNA recognition motif-containing protein